jgi:phage-related minor tail protein
MSDWLNAQPTKELQRFQKLIVQDLYIKYLNKGLNYFEWENEKKDAIIELKDKEIEVLKEQLLKSNQGREQVDANFKNYIKKVKAAKVEEDKQLKQQDIIKQLRTDLDATKRRLQVSHRLNELIVKQNKK